MKKFFAPIVTALALAACAFGYVATTAKPAHAQPMRPQAPIFLQWESLGVAAGAQIQSPVLVIGNSTGGCNELIAVADNSAGGSTRALTVDWLGSDGTTILFRVSNTVAIAGRGSTMVSATASASTLPTGAVAVPLQPGLRMQATLAAAGAAAGSLAVYCR